MDTVISTPREARSGPGPDTPFLTRLSIATFAWVMGLGGLANAWYAAHLVEGVPLVVSNVLLAFSVIVYVTLLCLHLLKAILYWDHVKAEFASPVKSTFFPALSASTIVIAIGVRPWSYDTSEVLWVVGALVHIMFSITMVRRWILHSQDESVLTPAWFIPVVGNILVPLGGVPLGYVSVSWFFFSAGLVLWIVFFTIAMHRILFFASMSERSIPTLFILLAPPSVGLSSYFALNGGEIGTLNHVLYGFALFIAMLLASLWRHVTHGAFFMSWWAMTFPLDGFAGASLIYFKSQQTVHTEVIAWIALIAATAMVAWIFLRSLAHIASGKAFHED